MTCSVEICERPSRSRGWCHQHYKRWKRTGNVGANTPFGTKTTVPVRCSVADCERPPTARSMCTLHYDRARSGRDLHSRVALRYEPGQQCAVDSCENTARSRGWCQMHYVRWKATGATGPSSALIVRNKDALCDCGAKAVARGECRSCYRRRVYRENGDQARLSARAYRARKRDAYTIPFTAEQLAQRVAYYGARCYMCGSDWTDIDHVKPLAKGGPHMLSNLRPACASCNGAKSDRWPLSAVVTTNRKVLS